MEQLTFFDLANHFGLEEEQIISSPKNISNNLLNNISCGDCLKLLRNLPNESVDLIVSSPPYNIGKVENDRKPIESYLNWQKNILAECHRTLKSKGSIFWQVGTYVDNNKYHIPLDIRFFPILESLGMIPRNRIVWIRPHGVHAKLKFSGRYETILWFTKTMNYNFFLDPIKVPQKYSNKKYWKGEKKGELSCDPLGKNPGDIWAFRNVRHNHEEDTVHPAQFPEDLVRRIILCTTVPGDIVLDPFMGVGTTAVVAKRLNRFYCGAEINEEYVSIANQRISCQPDSNLNFPNLKTLREYAKKKGVNDVSTYKFTRQRKGSIPSLKSRAFPEEHHNREIIKRIEFEADNSIDNIFDMLIKE
ncbi:MAG: site-specific DNA-methyltransferase [Candidatus Eremiobacteraeota bacterium]|nr:site-specific DNA-methyltransferase [Candidatus Eremiobacteraeota bacterium]